LHIQQAEEKDTGLGTGSSLCSTQHRLLPLAAGAARGYADCLPPGWFPSLDSVSSDRQHAQLSLFSHPHALSTAITCRVRLLRRHMEATYADMLCGCEKSMQASRGYPKDLWHARPAVHDARHQLPHIFCTDLHHASPCTFH